MLLIATLVNHPGIGHSDTETSDSKYHDALLEVQSQLQKISAEFNIELYRLDDYYGKGKVGFRRIWLLQLIYHDIAWYLICEDCENGHLSVERMNRFTGYCEIIDSEGRGLALQEHRLKIAQKLLKNG